MATVEIDLGKGVIKSGKRKVTVKGDIMATLRKHGYGGMISGNMMYINIEDAEEIFALFGKSEYKYNELVKIAKEHGIKTYRKRKNELEKELRDKGYI